MKKPEKIAHELFRTGQVSFGYYDGANDMHNLFVSYLRAVSEKIEDLVYSSHDKGADWLIQELEKLLKV